MSEQDSFSICSTQALIDEHEQNTVKKPDWEIAAGSDDS
jgi:hypothetical protein